MKSFLLAALQTIVKALLTPLNYERIKQLVIAANDTSLSGEEKKQLVLKSAALIIEEVGRDLVSIAIKTIVLSLRK